MPGKFKMLSKFKKKCKKWRKKGSGKNQRSNDEGAEELLTSLDSTEMGQETAGYSRAATALSEGRSSLKRGKDDYLAPVARLRAKKSKSLLMVGTTDVTQLKSGLKTWTLLMFDAMRRGSGERTLLQIQLDSLIQLVKLVNADLDNRAKPMDDIFGHYQLEFNYFEAAHAFYDEQILNYFDGEMELICEQILAQGETASGCHDSIFELYSLLSKFSRLVPKTMENLPSIGVHKSFNLWFQPIILQLVISGGRRARSDIQKQVLLDDLHENDAETKVTWSAVNAATQIYKMPSLWKSLTWPHPKFSYIILEKMSQVICDCAVSYGESLENKMEAEFERKSEGKKNLPFISYEFCRAINSLEYIRSHCIKVQDQFQPSAMFDQLQVVLGSEQRRHCEEHLSDKFETARRSLHLIHLDLVKKTTDEVKSQIFEYVAGLFKSEREGSAKRLMRSDAAQQRVEAQTKEWHLQLLEYLEKNLTVVMETLAEDSECRRRIVSSLWTSGFEAFKINTKKAIQEGQRSQFFARIEKRWTELQNFPIWRQAKFYQASILEKTDFEDLTRTETLIHLHSKSTAELKWDFLKERAKDVSSSQNSASQARISFRAAFNFSPRGKKLTIHIDNCTGLKFSDGPINPYVKVQLFLWRSGKSPWEPPYTTAGKITSSTITGDCELEFNQSLSFELSSELLGDLPVGWIFLTLKNSRFIKKNRVLGEAVFSTTKLQFSENISLVPGTNLPLALPALSPACAQILDILAGRPIHGHRFAKQQRKKISAST